MACFPKFVNFSILKSIYQVGSSLRSVISNIQNKAVKIISFTHKFEGTYPLFLKANILRFSDIVTLDSLLFMHAFVTNSLLVSFQVFFSLVNQNNLYETRRSCRSYLKVISVNTTKFGIYSLKGICIRT